MRTSDIQKVKKTIDAMWLLGKQTHKVRIKEKYAEKAVQYCTRRKISSNYVNGWLIIHLPYERGNLLGSKRTLKL